MEEKNKGQNNRYIYYVVLMLVMVGGAIGYFKMQREIQKENPQITELAVEPDLLITSADRYLHDHKRRTSIEFLEEAIELMRLFEQTGDSLSNQAIEVAIGDLQAVEDHIKAEDINDELMYEAFADAMNSLALASLRVSEGFIMQGKEDEAEKTMEYAMQHLQNSIKYARGQQKEEEIKIVTHLNELIENHLQNDLSEIDQVMAKIDSVVRAHVIK